MKYLWYMVLVVCSSVAAIAQQEQTVTIASEGVERTFLLHLPSAAPEAGLPLLLCYHGAGGASEIIEYVTGFSDLADKYNFVVAYPQAVRINSVVQWNAYVDDKPGHGGVHADDAPDDVMFTHAVIDYIAEHYAIDKQRVYATGLSSGGFMSYGLALMSPGTVQAIAPVAANVWGDDAYITKLAIAGEVPVIPIMHTHGTDDPTIGYIDKDDQPGDYQEYPLFLFSRSCGVHTYTAVEPIMENVDRLVFCNEPKPVWLIRIRGMEHSWSDDKYPTSLAIVQFFGLASAPTQVAEREPESGYDIAPNPVDDVLRITAPSAATVSIYTITGQEVYRTTTGSGTAEISCATLIPGAYTVYIQTGERTTTRLVVVGTR